MENIKNILSGSGLPGTNKGGTVVKVLDYVIALSIGLSLFLTPLFFTGLTSQGMGFDKMTLFYFLALIGIVCWATKGIILGELSLKRTPLDLPILGVLILYVISTVASVSHKDSMVGSYGNSARGLAALVVFILFYYLVVNNINTKRIKIFFWSIVGSGAVLSVFSLLQLLKVFIIPAAFAKSPSFNTIGSLSGLTMFLVALLPILAVAITHAKDVSDKASDAKVLALRVSVGIVMIADLAVLALLNGFTFWPVAIASIVVVLMFLLSKVVKTDSNILFVPIAAFFVLIMLLVLGNFNFLKMDLPVEVSLSRGASWDIAKASLKENPMFGSGPSTFYWDFSKFRNQNLNYSALWDVRFDNASGVVFELLANVGALGTLGAVVIVLIALSISFLSTIKTGNKGAQPIMLGLFSSFIALVIFALLFSFNNSMILLAVLMSTMAIATAIHIYPEKFKTLDLSFRASANYALALAAIFLSVSAGVVVLFIMGLKMFMADVYVSQAVASADIGTKVEKLNKAVALAPYQDIYYLELSKNYMALANQDAQAKKDQTAIANNLNSAIEAAKKAAIEINPNNANNIESLALVYENASFYTTGALQLAEEQYNNEMKLEPQNPVPYLRLALVNMAKANLEQKPEEQTKYIEEAIKQYDLALAKKNDFGAAYYGKGVAYERMNKVSEAVEELKKAVLSTRDSLDYRFELGRMLFNRGVVQPDIAQNNTTDITKGETEGDKLSVAPTQATGGAIKRNEDLNTAEQIFQGILASVPNNANSIYSLALLYQKIGENDKAKAQVTKLLQVLSDEQQIDLVKKQFPGLY